ncbi:hypothetical protein VNO77_41752 [Canavalia gladiata]|uniref:Uncharacterized protein n=1 Tax=Canavalia gladiata TaxID=3824 RepID=A0AAN9JZ20_CANGL
MRTGSMVELEMIATAVMNSSCKHSTKPSPCKGIRIYMFVLIRGAWCLTVGVSDLVSVSVHRALGSRSTSWVAGRECEEKDPPDSLGSGLNQYGYSTNSVREAYKIPFQNCMVDPVRSCYPNFVSLYCFLSH